MKTLARIALTALLLACSASSLAASLAERSPFTQGHWWDPTRPGSGFDFFAAGGQVVVNWYTYDANGKSIWYTAQGERSSLGAAWPLLKHRWVNGRKAEAVVVGDLRVAVENADAAMVEWTVEGIHASRHIEPFVQAGASLEVDHTGSWFAPDNSGWGFALTQQGDVMGGVLFTYDANGDPVWAAGFDRGSAGSVALYRFSGTCPTCVYASPQPAGVGRLAFDFTAEWEMKARASSLTLPMAPGVQVEGAHLFQLSVPVSARPADRQLAAFDTAASLKAYLDAGMLNMANGNLTGGADFSAAPPSVSTPYSTTNLQESGVDEADLVKFDGRFAYAFLHNASGVREPVIRMAELAADGSAVAIRSTLALSGPPKSVESAGLYLSGGKLVSVTGTVPNVNGAASVWAPSSAWANGSTQVEVFDASSPDRVASRWYAVIDGHPVASRRIGDRLYVVTRFVPSIPGFAFGAGSSSAPNGVILANTRLDAMVPKRRVNGGAAEDAVAVTSIQAPPQGSMRPYADMLVLTSIDLASPRVTDSIAVIGAVEAVYVSPRNLYLATLRQNLREASGTLRPPASTLYEFTNVHQIALGESGMSIVGTGLIEGLLGSQLEKTPFRLSEDKGRLRVVTSSTFDMGDWGLVGNRNRVTILEPSTVAPGVLKTVSVLPSANHPGMLGLPFEELYATRFVGDKLYAVTFTSARFVGQAPSVDPLFVVDLANPLDPAIRGELVIPGFSDYLHPLGNGLLLGFGRSVTTNGVVQGLQLSLFDVSDEARPRAIQQVTIGKRGSDSALLQSHHAFSALPTPDGNLLFAFPARVHDGTAVFDNGDRSDYPWQQSGLARYLVQGSTPATARLVALNPLITRQVPQTSPSLASDPAAAGARSILFPASTVYVANGQFWRQDIAGNVNGPL